MLSKLDDIELYLAEEDIDILCLTEHWLNDVNIKSINLQGYYLNTYFCRQKRIGGGVLFLVRENINVKTLDSINKYSRENDIEASGICYTNTVFLCIYRPPLGNIDVFFNNLISIIEIALKKGKYVVLLGDLNINYNSTSTNRNILCDIFACFQMRVATDGPTRLNIEQNVVISESSIDYFVTNLAEEKFVCEIINPELSDHFSHISDIFNLHSSNDLSNTRLPIRIERNYKFSNLQQLKNVLQSENWNQLYESCNVETSFAIFYQKLNAALDTTCPIEIFTKKNNITQANWYTNDLKQMKEELNNIFWIHKQTATSQARRSYTELKKKYKNQLRIAKSLYYNNLISAAKNKPKKIWSIINNKLGRHNKPKGNISLALDNNHKTSEPAEVANLFVNYFSTIADNKIQNYFGSNVTLPCTKTNSIEKSIYISDITIEEIHSTINKLHNKHSAGADGIPLKTISFIVDSLSIPLSYLFTQSLNQGIFPSLFKKAVVVPLHKKGNTEEMGNYRQISILNTFSKIFEKIVYNRLIQFFNKHKIFSKNQHGFTANRSVESATNQLLNHIYSNIDEGNLVVSLLFDLSIAFDSIDRGFLWEKLSNIGVRGHILKWLKSYLTGRKISVKHGVQSDSREVCLGVPQGSVLGPLLFLLYINDLPEHITSGYVTIFADDTTVTVTASTSEELLHKVLKVQQDMETWCSRNRLILNECKTECINFYAVKNKLSSDLLPVKCKDCVKFLGTMIDKNLNWYCQVDYICSKLNSAFYAILQLKYVLDVNGLLNTYYALAYCHIAYNIVSWGSTCYINRVFVSQKRITRLIFNLKYRESCRQTFILNNILTVPCIYIYIYKAALYNHDVEINRVNNYHEYNTRHGSTLLEINKCNKKFTKKSPLNTHIAIYNKLPLRIKKLTGKNCFKIKLKDYLIKNCFYSLSEYLSSANDI